MAYVRIDGALGSRNFLFGLACVRIDGDFGSVIFLGHSDCS